MADKPAGYAQEQTAIALAYKNNKMIADEILPRVTVDTKHYKWLEYDLAAGFTLPNTNWSPRSDVTEVDIAATDRERGCLDYGVGDHIPNDDISQSTDKAGILNRKTEFLTQIMVLDREVRVAGLVQNPANYAAENVSAPTLPWADPEADPVGEVRAALSAMMLRGNVAVFGRELWELFAAHPKVVSRVFFVMVDAVLAATEFSNGEGGVALDSVIVHETDTGYAQCWRGDALDPGMGGAIALDQIGFSDRVREEWSDPLLWAKIVEAARNGSVLFRPPLPPQQVR